MKLIRALIPLLLLSIMLALGIETVLAQPAITGVEVINVAESSVTITWSTDEPGDSVAHYGTDKDLGFAVSNSSSTPDHIINLTDLSPGTRYYLEVQSTDADGNISKDNNEGKFYTFKTLKASVVNKTFVGTVVGNATSTDSFINATSTVTLIRQGKGERITIALPDTYTLKTPGGPRAGTFGEGARVVIRAVRAGEHWVAESVLVKPVSPNVPVTGVVIGLDETNMTVMTQDGLTHTFELADDAGRPSRGDLLTVFLSPSSNANGKAKGLVRREEVFQRLQAFLESAFDSESSDEVDYLGQLLEDHGAQSIKIIDDVLPQAPGDAKEDISNSREKIRGASQAAKAAINSQKPATPPGLSNRDDRENQNSGQNPGEQPGPKDDDEQRGNSKGKGSDKQNPGKGPPDSDDADEDKGDEKQNPDKGRGRGEQAGLEDDEQRGKGKGKKK
ncbi:MAG: hypothetical protein IIC84_08725 [Chloroflexi bacterium]|nr:hypothetical protein [Chloroflexota bacterium]